MDYWLDGRQANEIKFLKKKKKKRKRKSQGDKEEGLMAPT